jgi:hypothetical protein
MTVENHLWNFVIDLSSSLAERPVKYHSLRQRGSIPLTVLSPTLFLYDYH